MCGSKAELGSILQPQERDGWREFEGIVVVQRRLLGVRRYTGGVKQTTGNC